MRENRSTFEILGALLGLVILIVILYAAVGYFRQGATEFNEVSRVVGRPVTLAESLSGEPITSTAELTGTAALTNTTALTGAPAFTGTTAITNATDVTATNAITAAAGTTTTSPLETGAITPTTDLTDTTPVTATIAVTASQTATATTDVTATTAITEDTPLAETSATTRTTVVTATNVVTTSDSLTEAGELTTTGATTGTTSTSADVEEAAPEVAAIFVKAACIGCHVIPGVPNAAGQIGPNLTNIGVTAATRIEGYSSEEYIRESLLEPNKFIAPQCPTGPCLPNLMVQNLGDILTSQELDTVVAYLTTLGTK